MASLPYGLNGEKPKLGFVPVVPGFDSKELVSIACILSNHH